MKQFLSIMMAALLLSTATLSSASAADVFATKNGKKYHAADCRWIKNRDVVKMSEEEAIKKGLAPCGQCMNKDDAQPQEQKKDGKKK